VLDRYWWSTWVYGIIGGVRPEILQALIEVERLAWDKWQPGILFHVTRLTPLREEPADTWPKLVTEYDSLASREAGKYPIQTLSNEGDVEDTVAKAISLSHGL
jgi:dTMP kinase